MGEEFGFHLQPCEYGEKKHAEIFVELLGSAEKEYDTILSAGSGVRSASEMGSLGFILQFIETAPTIKDPSFLDEREWRLIHTGSAWSSNVKFRDTGSLMVPFVELNLGKGTEKRLPIKEVVIGPTPHLSEERRAISAVLTVHGLEEAVVTPTEIPYRDW